MWYHFNAVNFHPNPSKKHPIVYPLPVMHNLPHFWSYHMQNHVIFACAITTLFSRWILLLAMHGHSFWMFPCDIWFFVLIVSIIYHITHCLKLGHETMVCAVCLFIFLGYRYTLFIGSPLSDRYYFMVLIIEETFYCTKNNSYELYQIESHFQSVPKLSQIAIYIYIIYLAS